MENSQDYSGNEWKVGHMYMRGEEVHNDLNLSTSSSTSINYTRAFSLEIWSNMSRYFVLRGSFFPVSRTLEITPESSGESPQGHIQRNSALLSSSAYLQILHLRSLLFEVAEKVP